MKERLAQSVVGKMKVMSVRLKESVMWTVGAVYRSRTFLDLFVVVDKPGELVVSQFESDRKRAYD